MKTFRLPRKIKKKLKGAIWLYPADEKGNSLLATPTRSQEDYDAVKQGIVTDLLADSTKASRKKEKEILANPIEVSDKELRRFVDNIFAKEYRNSSYNILIEARSSPKAIVAYYNFINAYNLVEKGEDSFGNICCMSIDYANDLLKGKRMKK